MKNKIFNFIFTLFLCASSTELIAQYWNITGNNVSSGEWLGADTGSDEPVSFEHHADDPNSMFVWSTHNATAFAERMRLTRAGWLGLNTIAPSMMFHVHNGGILSTGTTGANPDLGAGTRLMWVPSQTAFRAGSVTGTQWDGGNVGSGSYSLGVDNTASGYISSALGYDNSVSGNFSQAFGLENEITGAASSAIGKMNFIDGAGSLSLGCFTQSSEDFGFILGTGVDGSNLLTNTIENSLYVGFNSDIPTLFVGPSAGVDEYGHVGVNTTSPEMLLHVEEGGLLATATAESPTTPDLGTGTRLIWMPDLGALRAGFVVTNEWDPINVGENSVAFGQSSIALGEASFAAGHYNNVSSETGMALGRFNVLEIADPPQPGRAGIAAFAAGRANNVDGDSGMALGLNNLVQSQAGVALGELNEVSGVAAVAGGFRSESHGEGSIALGHEAIADADKCLAFGSTYNDIEESMLVGFNVIGDVLFAGPGASGGPVSGVGIGGIDEPTERLDVDGNARFRDMPSGAGTVLITGVEEDAAGDYSLSTIAFGSAGQYLDGTGAWVNMPPAEQCDWNLNGQNIIMGYAGSTPVPACRSGNVGIGTHNPTGGKLTVQHSDGTSIYARMGGMAASINSIHAKTSVGANSQESVAVRADNSLNTSCSSPYTGSTAYGLKAYANNGEKNFAVYGEAIPHISVGGEIDTCASYESSWAGYFNGATFSPGGVWTASDEQLKTDINDAPNASDLLALLSPKTYKFNHQAFEGLHLPRGTHWGIMAQNLEEVLPGAVTSMYHPARLDSTGALQSPGYTLKAVNYAELIPMLIQGHNEMADEKEALKAEVDELKDLVNELSELVQNCCTSGSDKSLQGSGSTGSSTESADFDLQIEKATLDQNVPNPFQNETSITYRIPAQAMVRVRILGQSGQQIDTLVDGLMPKGEYKIIWNASHLPAGMYYYTLEADGIELVKKAVKL